MVQLGELCEINMGQSPDSSTYNVTGEGLPFFQGNADFGELYPSVRMYCSKPIKIAEEGNILISVRAPIGALNIANKNCCIGRGLAAINPKEGVSYAKYLYYLLLANHDKLVALGTGSTFKAITGKVLLSLNVKEIPYEQQIEISNLLDRLDVLILKRKQQLKKLDLLVKSQFIELFGDVITNSKDWDLSSWSMVLTIKNGRNQRAVECKNGAYPIYGSGGEIGRANDYICNENSVVIGRKGNINKPLFVTTKFWNVDTAFGLEPSNKIVSEYLYLFCLIYDFEQHNKAVTIPSLTKSDLLNIQMPIPPIELQNEFASFVEQTDKSKNAIKQSLEKLQTLKKALMQNYFG